MKRINEIRARLAEIRASLGEFQALAALTPEQLTTADTLTKEFEALTKELSVLEKAQAALGSLDAGTGRETTPNQPNPQAAIVLAPASDRFGGFNSMTDFFNAVKKAGQGGGVHEKLQNGVHFEKNGEDGGFLVPTELNTAIQKVLSGEESLLSRTRQFTIGGNSLAMPIDETQPWNSGVQAYWVEEGGQIKDTKAKIKMANWRLHKAGAMVKLTDELMEDAVAMANYIQTQAPIALMYLINSAIIGGDGTGKPTGFLDSKFTYTVAKETGQTADTVVARNVINMYARMLPPARAGSVWLINPSVEPQLLTMKDDNGNFIYLAPGSQMNASPYALLMGRPVIPLMSGLPGLGDSGDICFVNLQYYYSILKGGVKQASSIHMHFDREITAFRFTQRIDGSVPFTKTVTTEKGDYEMSAFVKLADRA